MVNLLAVTRPHQRGRWHVARRRWVPGRARGIAERGPPGNKPLFPLSGWAAASACPIGPRWGQGTTGEERTRHEYRRDRAQAVTHPKRRGPGPGGVTASARA